MTSSVLVPCSTIVSQLKTTRTSIAVSSSLYQQLWLDRLHLCLFLNLHCRLYDEKYCVFRENARAVTTGFINTFKGRRCIDRSA
jgi:hypothetical protein